MARIAQEMAAALNAQLNREMFSSHLYLSMAAFFEARSLKGLAHWMRMQAEEEALHVHKFFDYVNDRGGRVTLEAIDKPKSDWSSPVEVFQEALAHEETVTGNVHDLVRLATELRDRATESFLRWFVDEQVEEESAVDQIVNSLTLGGDNPAALLLIDREMAARPKPVLPAP